MEKQVFPCMLGHFPSTGRMRKKCGNVEMQTAMEKVEILWSGKHTNVEKIVEYANTLQHYLTEKWKYEVV